jgi:hypothetical protein
MKHKIWHYGLVMAGVMMLMTFTMGQVVSRALPPAPVSADASAGAEGGTLTALVVVRAASGASYLDDRDYIATMPKLESIAAMQAHVARYEPHPRAMQRARAALERRGFKIVAQDNLFIVISGARETFERMAPGLAAQSTQEKARRAEPYVLRPALRSNRPDGLDLIEGLIVYPAPAVPDRPTACEPAPAEPTLAQKPFLQYAGTHCPDESMTSQELADLLHADRVHAQGILGTDVDVALIDMGVYAGHQAFSRRPLNLRSYRFVDGSITVVGNNFIDGQTEGHGTMVASNLWAIAPNARLHSFAMPVQPAQQGAPDNVIAAYLAYINQEQFPDGRLVDIISLSWGATEENPEDDLYRPDIRQEMINFMGKGGIVLVAAGNANQTVDGQVTSGHNGLAAIPEVIAVGGADFGSTHIDYRAAGNYEGRCNNTSTGSASFDSIDYPGRHVPDVVGVFGPDLCFPWPTYKVPGIFCHFWQKKVLDAFYRYADGTSGATPQLAGMLALLKERRPGLNQTQARSVLQEVALDITQGVSGDGDPAGAGYDEATGYGIPIATRVMKQWQTLYPGWNLIGLAKDHGSSYQATDLLDEINQQGFVCDNVTYWDPSASRYRGVQVDEGGNVFGFDFALELGVAYWVQCNTMRPWVESGNWITTPQTVHFQAGWNFVAIPYSEVPCTAGDVLHIPAGCQQVFEYDGHVSGMQNVAGGEQGLDFPLAARRGYIAFCTQDYDWTPSCAGDPTLAGDVPAVPGNYYAPHPTTGARVDRRVARAMEVTHATTGGGSPCVPQEVRISNLSDRLFSVSWTTEAPCMGSVIINTGTDPSFRAYDDRGLRFAGTTHHVTIRGLAPETTYSFGLFSGDVWDNNGGQYYQVRTGAGLYLPGTHYKIHGQLAGVGGTQVRDAVVYAQLENHDVTPADRSTVLSFPWDGSVTGYLITLDNARTEAADAYFSPTSATHVWLEVEGGSAGQDGVLQFVDLGTTPSVTGTLLTLEGATLGMPGLTAPVSRTVSLRPTFRFAATDSSGAALTYRLELGSAGFETVARVYDQRFSSVGWSAASYASGQEARFTLPEPLENLNAYQWRVFAYNGEVWSSASDTRTLAVTRYHDVYLPEVMRNAGAAPASDQQWQKQTP